jgi:hypothetical protein
MQRWWKPLLVRRLLRLCTLAYGPARRRFGTLWSTRTQHGNPRTASAQRWPVRSADTATLHKQNNRVDGNNGLNHHLTEKVTASGVSKAVAEESLKLVCNPNSQVTKIRLHSRYASKKATLTDQR